MSHCMLPGISGLKICGVDCVLSAEWKSPSKIIARTGPGKGKGDVVVITRSGGVGSCTVGFRGYFVQTGESELGSDIVKSYRYLYRPVSFQKVPYHTELGLDIIKRYRYLYRQESFQFQVPNRTVSFLKGT